MAGERAWLIFKGSTSSSVLAGYGRGPAPHDQQVRQRYLEAVRQADTGDLGPLLGFVRS